MKDILLYVHTHKPLYASNCDWKKMVSTQDVDGATRIPFGIDGVRLDEFDSFINIKDEDAKYLGVCHYRRRPLFLNQTRSTHPKIFIDPTGENLNLLCSEDQRLAAIEILDSHDVIQYRPCMLEIDYREQFGCYTPLEAFDIMVDVLKQLGMSKSVGFYKTSNAHVWATLLVTTKEILSLYAEFVVNVVKIMLARDDFQKLLITNNRLLPLMLERLTPLWVFHNRLKSAFVPAVILEKDA